MPPGARSKGRLLVVEDDAYVCESLGAILRGRGYEVTLAGGVESALGILLIMPVDLILTDLNMPDGGGLALVKQARSLRPGIPIVVLTGFGTVTSAVDCLKAGASDYVLKPAEPEALERAMERALCRASPEKDGSRSRNPSSTER